MSKYDAKMRPMKRNLYEGPRSYRETMLTLVCKSTIRANVPHILASKHTPSQYSWFFARYYTNHNALFSTGNSMLRKQHAKAMASAG